MKKALAVLIATSGWFAIIAQYTLMIENRVASLPETTIRFFSFFTILTNLLVAFYFTARLAGSASPQKAINRPGMLTALTVYITVVGLVYQVILRPLWAPTGLQKLVDELLHTVIPLLVIVYWHIAEHKRAVRYMHIPKWLIYPLVYLLYILVRGHFSGFYPYPFVNVATLGIEKVMINAFFMLLLFSGLSVLLIAIGKTISR